MKKFFLNIIKADTRESSKRFIALFSMLLITYVVVRYTNQENATKVLEYLLVFVGSLCGITVTQAIVQSFRKKPSNDESNEESD